MKRRTFLALSAGALCTFGVNRKGAAAAPVITEGELPFRLSLAEWSLVRNLKKRKITNMDFPRIAKQEFGIDCIEFVDQFFADKSRDQQYLQDLKKRAEDEGVKMGLIMIDTTGPLGAADKSKRDAAVEKTCAWIDAAKFLGCKTVRVNAFGDGNADELRGRVAESCTRLADYAAPMGINIAIENHGKLTSVPEWLISVMKAVNKPNFGTLPDFGNFPDDIDRYDAVEKFMPYAKAVSAKATSFTKDGQCAETNFDRMMRIVRDGGYTGYFGIESGAETDEGEYQAVKTTRDLLLRIREDFTRRKQIFNGMNLNGWTSIGGGDWTVTDGVLIGRNGKNWSTNPEVAGSWLRTDEQYGDFRLELQYAVNEGGNSGVFFRSGAEKNPAFTGYEMQIVNFFGQQPSKQGAGSIYDTVAPTKNLVRRAGEWNSATIIAKGDKINFEINGETVLETEQQRSGKGYIGLQNHDEKSEVRFKNIRIEQL
jgi:sugar phosphate isomerase/epimerase